MRETAAVPTGGRSWIEPTRHWENVETKRRLHNLVNASGLIDHLVPIKPRAATEDELAR